ncbi:Metallo-dependent phosphatase-like protein [Hysterangium stoloniferum]|nr:Metallo-dependent phosphatase-like protein [Hysterangium stoloniferum]
MKLFLALLAVGLTAYACSDHDGHSHEARSVNSEHQPKPPTISIATPGKPLVWGDINIIHTTDSHGWLLGHQKTSPPEPNYSGDFGDFATFVKYMKAEAKAYHFSSQLYSRVDLLLVDSGDLHDGTGLSDGFPSGGVDAHDSNAIFALLPYDLLAIGNHELYIYANALDVHQNFAPKWNGRYLSSNVNITVSDRSGKPISIPVGERFAKFKTEHGRKVTALGVLFDFTGNDRNTTVQPVADMVNEEWFKEAITEEPDFFLLAGHMPVQKDNWPLVFNAVRAAHPTIPILILGGHTHIRDCVQLDSRSMSLESGRYMETVGTYSAKLDHKKSTEPIKFNRRYLDPNVATYEFHTGSQFQISALGLEVKSKLNALAKKFDLSFQYGTAPQDYTLSRAPFTSNQSLLALLANDVLPTALAINNTRTSIPHTIITNSGSMRFDIYAGPFTKNDQLTASPFSDSFQFLSDIPFTVASRVLDELNGSGLSSRKRSEDALRDLYRRGDVSVQFRQWLESQWQRSSLEARTAHNLTLGYVTNDACPGIGDDTIHSPLPFFSSPDFIGSPLPEVPSGSSIDLVFVDFINSDVIQIVNTINAGTGAPNVSLTDIKSYSDVLANVMFGLYAELKWG